MKHLLLSILGFFFLCSLATADTLLSPPPPPVSIAAPPPMAPPASAAPVPSTASPSPAPSTPTFQNEATVAVSDQSSIALQLALQAAFSEVMIKSTGDAKIMAQPLVQTVSANISEVVQSYNYIQSTNTGSTTQPPLTLHVVFDSNALQQLLQTLKNTADNQPNTPPPATQIKLMITGVKNMNDYAQMMQALHQIPGVTSLSVISMDPDRIAIEAHLSVDVSQFENSMTATNQLKPLMTTTPPSDGATPTLFYLWSGAE